MRTPAPLLLLVLLAIGCDSQSVPKEKYFGGEPVDHWLEEIRNPDAKRRKKAADILGNVGPIDARSIPALMAAVQDEDARVRDAAVLGLSKMGPPAAPAETVLIDATQDKDPTVRAHAAAALERIRS